jgi:adenylate cyclase
MSDVFISYARSAEDDAQRIAEALRKLGHDVWRDDALPAHRAYPDVIEERLRAAKAVVVIWSADAARSQWVRAEADVAREAGTLVQLSLDGTRPPLPFTQIQCADMTGWAGETAAPGWQKVVLSVAELINDPRDGAVPAQLAHPPTTTAARMADFAIAVLPFDNLSNDPEQEYFADGIAEDLLTALSKFQRLMVIARNSSFIYKGRAHDVRQVGRELGVRYVLEGSVRKTGRRVRVSCQLIDASSGNHIWAERYDRELVDIFDLQDEITLTIAAAIVPELSKAEQDRVRRKPLDSLDCWDLYQRGLWHLWRYTNEAHAEAKRLFEAAIELDPDFAPAHSHLALCIFAGIFNNLGEPPEALPEARSAALRAIAIDEKEAIAHFVLGRCSTQMGDHDAAIAALETAIRINPSLAQAHYGLGNALTFGGQPEAALPELELATRLSPHDPSMWAIQVVHAAALLLLNRMDEAEKMARAATRHPSATFWVYVALASALGHLGRTEEAREALAKLLELNPDYSATFAEDMYRGGEKRNSAIIEGLYKAGLPRPTRPRST